MKNRILHFWYRGFTFVLGGFLLWIFLNIYINGSMLLTEMNGAILYAEITVSAFATLVGLYGMIRFFWGLDGIKSRHVQMWSKRDNVYVLLDRKSKLVVGKSREVFNGVPMRVRGKR